MDKVNSYMDKVNLKLQDALLTAKRLSGDLERGATPCQANPDLGPFLHEIQSLFVFLESRIEEQRRLREVTIKANAGVLLDDILYHIYDSFRLLVPYDRIGMALLEQSGTYLRARWARSSASQLRLQRGYGAPMAGSSLQTIIETRQPRIINDLEVHLAEHPDSGSTRLIVEEGFRSSLTCPLIALGKPVGFLFFSSVSPGTYRTTHVNTYLKIAEQISVIVEKGRLYEELNRCNQILESEISERKKAEEVAVAARTTAEAATRAKSEFLAYMSHEIRTPMNGIIGMTELALETPLSQQQRAYLTLVKSSADSLLTVINDVLDFSKIEAGKLDIDEVPFDLRECLDDTLSTLALRAYGKGLELACRIAPDVPNAVVGDSGRLRQVLVNLVGNAIKFTERGEVVVSAEVESCHEAVVSIHCSVADTGIGIAPEKARTIFEPFVQCNGLAMRKSGGTGLGLTISAKLTALMGGRIWVDSEVGRGSTFHFTVQLGRKHDIPPRHTGEAVRLKGLRVLIVDDNQTSRRILEEVLTGWGARPKSVDGGPAALAALESAEARGEPFAVALLDDLMPGMDGFDLAELIRREPQWSDLTLALLTSNARQGASRALSRAGYLRLSVEARAPVGAVRCADEESQSRCSFGRPRGDRIGRGQPAGVEATPCPPGRGPRRQSEGRGPNARTPGSSGHRGRRR